MSELTPNGPTLDRLVHITIGGDLAIHVGNAGAASAQVQWLDISGNSSDLPSHATIDWRNGLIVSGFKATDTYAILMPAATGIKYKAWSAYPSDAAAISANQMPWLTALKVTGIIAPGVDGHLWSFNPAATGLDPGLAYGDRDPDVARSKFPSGCLITGYTSYSFWLADSNPADDRQGLSIVLELQ
jgi:hypothetical protein